MARHAGFGAVATVTETIVNNAILSYSREELEPFFFPLPTTITVGPTSVTFGGLMEMFPPTVELHANPGNLVTVNFVFRSTLRAQFTGQPLQTWTIQFSGSADAGLVTTTQNNQIILGIDTTQVVFQPLAVQVLNGPALPGPILNALQSQTLANAVTNFVQSRPPLTVAPPLFTSQLNFTQPLELPWFIAPSWFTINLTVNNIAVKVLEQAITVGVDFAGLTSGNANNLIDLTAVKGSGSMYKYTLTPNSEPSFPGPPLTKLSEPKGGDIAVAVNMGLISAVVSQQISPQIHETPISVSPNPEVDLMSIGVSHAYFNKSEGPQDGLQVNFHVYVKEGPEFGVDGRLLVQVYLQTADGPTEFLYNNPDVWRIYVAKVEADLPWWVDAIIIGLTIYFSAAIPFIAPLLGLAAGALLGGVIPSLLESAESQSQQAAQGAVSDVAFPPPWSEPLPGLTAPDWDGMLKYVSFTPDAIDTALHLKPSVDLNAEPRGTITPQKWEASNKNPINVELKLRSDLERLADNNPLFVTWSVRRADTNQVVATAVKSYNDPVSNGLLVPHHTQQLYHVDSFIVSCTATLTVGNQVGDVWSGTQTIQIWDILDRHHKYVEWGPHVVYFQNDGTGWEWWSHNRKSCIHRTAVSARCKMLRDAADRHNFTVADATEFPFVAYKDTLPFAWSQLNAHRKPLCEYCFFGGPEKSNPFPQADWF